MIIGLTVIRGFLGTNKKGESTTSKIKGKDLTGSEKVSKSVTREDEQESQRRKSI